MKDGQKMEKTSLMNIPRCPVHVVQLIHRTRTSMEADFCGTWYDCPHCAHSVLLPSKELTAQLEGMRPAKKEAKA